MYGLIGRMKAVAGKREALVEILLGSTQKMPGCRSYVVALDPTDLDALWVTEVWDDQASHKASLSLPEVRSAIEKAKPLISSFGDYFVTEPIGGYGLSS